MMMERQPFDNPIPRKRPRLERDISTISATKAAERQEPIPERVDDTYSISYRVSPFAILPIELRLKIWEYTWPAAQVIEAAIREEFDDNERSDFKDDIDDESTELADDAGYKEFTILRPVSALGTLLRRDFSSRHLETKFPLEKYLPPIALWICQESRLHTLKSYALIQHPDLPECSFYFNPLRDLLWLSCDITSDSERLKELQASYQTSITQFRILLVEDTEWGDWDISSSLTLSILPALQTVALVLDDFEDDRTPITYSADENRNRAMYYQDQYSELCEAMELSASYQLESCQTYRFCRDRYC
ncbi:2EXR domain-containing protein [Aspergillus lucknowensis]|uniref:2EXR domain-containing protein n=1 Tax=Aspergillus lucknowensis TaxID=176173 RepID=A0ABR4L8Z7_9EURO